MAYCTQHTFPFSCSCLHSVKTSKTVFKSNSHKKQIVQFWSKLDDLSGLNMFTVVQSPVHEDSTSGSSLRTPRSHHLRVFTTNVAFVRPPGPPYELRVRATSGSSPRTSRSCDLRVIELCVHTASGSSLRILCLR